MKFSFVLPLFFSFFCSLNTYAQDTKPLNGLFEKTDQTRLKILGRGVKDRRTDASLTLACVGSLPDTTESQCTELRWVMFSEDQSYFVGKKIPVTAASDEASQKLLKQYLKELSQDAKKQSGSRFFTASAGVVGFSSTVIITSVLTGGVSALAFLSGWGFLIFKWSNTRYHGMNAFLSHPAYQAENTDSWNWSIDSKKINHSYFRAIFWDITGLSENVESTIFDHHHLNQSELSSEENESSLLMEKLELF
jgi:hypothetical protein